jgi:16S rRNA processing protein RimM
MIGKSYKAYFPEGDLIVTFCFTMNTAAYTDLGTIQRGQGLKGHLVVRLNHDMPYLDELSTLCVKMNHTLVPYCVEQFSLQRRKMVLKLQGVNDPKAANALQGCAILVPRDALPQQLPQAACLNGLLGYHVSDVQEGSLGTVQAIYTPSQQSLLAIDYQGRELLVPYHDAIVTHVDHEQRSIVVRLPNGFIEAVY